MQGGTGTLTACHVAASLMQPADKARHRARPDPRLGGREQRRGLARTPVRHPPDRLGPDARGLRRARRLHRLRLPRVPRTRRGPRLVDRGARPRCRPPSTRPTRASKTSTSSAPPSASPSSSREMGTTLDDVAVVLPPARSRGVHRRPDAEARRRSVQGGRRSTSRAATCSRRRWPTSSARPGRRAASRRGRRRCSSRSGRGFRWRVRCIGGESLASRKRQRPEFRRSVASPLANPHRLVTRTEDQEIQPLMSAPRIKSSSTPRAGTPSGPRRAACRRAGVRC